MIGDADHLKIGIALSGGGSRAIAFHLGCLRALNKLGILDKARVMATVSGGSVIGAMYACHNGSFDDFERQVKAFLRKGLLRPIIVTALTTAEGWRATLCFLYVTVSTLCFLFLRWLSHAFSFALAHPDSPQVIFDQWMPRRFASRTTILRRAMDDLLFKGKTFSDLRRNMPRLIAIATELRTGSAFYFSAGGVGSWRVGKIDPDRMPVAHAVAASAAYPLLLPALDEVYHFQKRDGSLSPERVTLTDGGVYDNLGLAPLWPNRDPEISVAVEAVDAIVACRAGYGLRTIPPSVFVISRLKAAYGALHNRAQNAAMNRLFDLRKIGAIRCFAIPYLDQNDDRLLNPPPDLIKRETVIGYPTNFSSMPDDWIERLSKRGEQLTLCVIRQHAPELLTTV
jgi:NTE family protein